MEQVTVGFTSEQGAPASTSVLGPIVQHVAALAEGGEVGLAVVGRVVIAMGGCQYHLGRADHAEVLDRGKPGHGSALAIAPTADVRIPPAAIAEMIDHLPMGSATSLTPARRASATASSGMQLRAMPAVRAVRVVERGNVPIYNRTVQSKKISILNLLSMQYHPRLIQITCILQK